MKTEHILYGCLEYCDDSQMYVFCSSACREDFDNLEITLEFDLETSTSEIKDVKILKKASE